MTSIERVAHVLRDMDIEGLFPLGAPSDEYDGEASEIAARLLEMAMPTKAAIALAVEAVWYKSFGPFSPEQRKLRCEAFEVSAERILECTSITR